jgi:amidase
VLSTANLLRSLGHEGEQLPFPFDVEDLSVSFLNYYGLFAFALKNFGGYFLKAKLNKGELENFTLGLSNQFKRNVFKVSGSLKKLKATGAAIESLFGKYDLIMTPVTGHRVPKIGHFSIELPYDEIARRAVAFAPFTGMQNISGAPGISLPLATSSDGMPLGIHFVAPLGQDKRLLEFAYEMEAAKPWKFIYNTALATG